MAVNARINTGANIGQIKVTQQTRSTIAAQNFSPKPNISLSEVGGVSTTGVQDGFTLIFNSNSGKFEAEPAANVTGTITQITGGFF
jgi:hypothetical protein